MNNLDNIIFIVAVVFCVVTIILSFVTIVVNKKMVTLASALCMMAAVLLVFATKSDNKNASVDNFIAAHTQNIQYDTMQSVIDETTAEEANGEVTDATTGVSGEPGETIEVDLDDSEDLGE